MTAGRRMQGQANRRSSISPGMKAAPRVRNAARRGPGAGKAAISPGCLVEDSGEGRPISTSRLAADQVECRAWGRQCQACRVWGLEWAAPECSHLEWVVPECSRPEWAAPE
jgi:hypothetical protein